MPLKGKPLFMRMKSLSSRTLLTTCLCFVLIGRGACYPQGPPSTVCSSMMPGHSAPAQTTPAPYTLTFSKNTYTPNEQITVTLSGNTASDTFQGFLIQPRTDVNSADTVGTFSNLPANSRNPCTGKTALSHTYPDMASIQDRQSIDFTWTAPPTGSGPVTFVYTVLKTKFLFWVKLQSDPITVETQTQTEPPDEITEPPTSSTPLPDKVINWDPTCGSTKGCFPTPEQCSINCDYLVKWQPFVDTDEVEFTIQRKAIGDKWIAIGFSDNRAMGNDSVVECTSVSGTVAVHSSYNIVRNPQNGNVVLDTAAFGITQAETSHIDGIITCKFRRKISADAVTGRKRAVADSTTFFDLNTPWYLLVAMGDMNGNNKVMHSETPKISTVKHDFLTVGADTPTPMPPGPVGEIVKPTGCGKTEGCYHDCNKAGKGCKFYVGWKKNGDYIEITMHSKLAANYYSAIGLSSDKQMGEDSCFECVLEGSKVSVFVSYNPGKSNDRLSPGTFGITNPSGSYKDGIMSCSFSRSIKASLVTGRRKRAAASASNFFDMNTDWYMFYAYGVASGAFISKHEVTPVVSSEKANFLSFKEVGAQAVGMPKLVLVHAILMVAAWMLWASVGIVAPTFYKPAWSQDTKICGLHIWFQIHRTCMVLAFLCCAAGFVVIFVHVGGYADIDGSNFEKAHPIMGIVVMALALINPIMALFRPDPKAPKRPVFNVFHSLVGSGAYIVAIVNLFAGIYLAGESVPDYVFIIMYVFCGWIGLFSIVLHLYQCSKRKTGLRGEAYELKGAGDSTMGLTDKGEGNDTFKIVALYIHIFVLLGLAVAVCVILGLKSFGGNGDDDGDS